ncbi:MAG: hypothetical protein K6G73_05545 [Marinilabiliaceae bacterium]|nr:hypothetical protein [Marinilabiliaceae bacterium]
MKRVLLLLVIAMLCSAMSSDDCITKDGYFRGKRLCGRVKIVDSFADFDVRVVTSLADLDVKKVTSFADDPGEWIFVDHFPDFTIRYVKSFPGVNHPCDN